MRLFNDKEKYADILKSFSEKALSLVFPQSIYCACCGNIIDSSRSYSLCDHCMTHIRWNADEPETVDDMKLIHCTEYGIYERSLIFALKYDGHRYIARDIGKIMADRLKASEINEENIIVPVPLHDKKQKIRGFNQAELIGSFLAKEMNWEMADVLVREKETRAMRGLGAEERESNVSGSMRLKKEGIDLIRNKDIMLIDDFYTTGSTAKECLRALSLGNPNSVTFLAFAGREWKKAPVI